MDLAAILDPSHLTAFIGGTAVGAAGKYLADLFTDQRKRKEEKKKREKRLSGLESRMQQLFAEMRTDLAKDGQEHFREFVILSSEVTNYAHSRPRLVYFESKQRGLQDQIAILVGEGLVDRDQNYNPPLYRVKEDLASWLRGDA